MQAEQDRQRASCEPYLIVSRGERGGDAGSMPEGVDLRWVGRWVATSRDGGGRCCVGGVVGPGMYCSLCGGWGRQKDRK